MSNINTAHQFAKQMAMITSKVWISDNMQILSRHERKAILKVYRQYFHTVDYDPHTGICKCWVNEPSDIESTGVFAKGIGIDTAKGNISQDVKQETYNKIGINEKDIKDVVIVSVDSDEETA